MGKIHAVRKSEVVDDESGRNDLAGNDLHLLPGVGYAALELVRSLQLLERCSDANSCDYGYGSGRNVRTLLFKIKYNG